MSPPAHCLTLPPPKNTKARTGTGQAKSPHGCGVRSLACAEACVRPANFLTIYMLIDLTDPEIHCLCNGTADRDKHTMSLQRHLQLHQFDELVDAKVVAVIFLVAGIGVRRHPPSSAFCLSESNEGLKNSADENFGRI
jgi:hypothetical protein